MGAFLSANCYAPQKYIRRWAWEIFWMTQAAWCWLLWPIIGALLHDPRTCGWFWPSRPKTACCYAFLMGMAYGVGGTAFNISIRYIGFSLTYAIAVGLSAVIEHVGHAARPRASSARSSHKTGSSWVVAGVAVGVAGHRHLRRRRPAEGT